MNREQIAARLEVSCFYPTDILVGAVEAIVREAVEAALTEERNRVGVKDLLGEPNPANTKGKWFCCARGEKTV